MDPKHLQPGSEQYENYSTVINRKYYYQYDYRHTDGELFSTVKPTLEQCRQARDKWVQEKEAK
jgi:hypothetical protein